MDCGAPNDGTVVAAHANHLDKGMGMKASDFMFAALCFKCHAFLDQGATLTREDRRWMWERAYWKTQAWLWGSGLVCVAPEHVSPEPPMPAKNKAAKGRKIPSRPFQKSGRNIARRKLKR